MGLRGSKGPGRRAQAVSCMHSAWTPVFPHSLFVDPIIPHSLSRPLAEGKMQGPALQGPKQQLTDEVLGKESQLQGG